MRILFATSLYLPWLGGLEVLAAQLVGELRSRGHEVAVLTATNDPHLPLGEVEVEGTRVLRTDAYRVTGLPDATRLLHDRRQLRLFVEDFAPDVVHAHDPGPLMLSYEKAVRQKTPLLLTLHNVMSLLVPDGLPTVVRAVRRADLVTGVSDDVVADALALVPDARPRLSLVRNGVAEPTLPVVPVPDGPARLLAVGRLVPQKGFDLAVDALALVVKEHPDVHLTVAGVGPGHGALVAQVLRLGLAQHVTLAGRVERAEVEDLLAASTALVMPSRFEGLPLVALEAAWAGRAVVGSDAPGLRCAVQDGVTGLLVPHSAPALAAALCRLVDDRDEARRLGAAARAGVEADWSLAACVDRYEALYRRLAA